MYSQGNVGIGTNNPSNKLEVAGWLKIGDQNYSGNDVEGALRYNSSKGCLEINNGDSWDCVKRDQTIIAGAGLYSTTNSSGTITIFAGAGAGLSANPSDLSVNTDGTTIGINGSDELTILNHLPNTRTLTFNGTANQIVVSAPNTQDLTANRSWTLSLPQNIHSAATPTFSDLTLTSLPTNRVVVTSAGGNLNVMSSGVAGQVLTSIGASAPYWSNATGIINARNGLTETNPNIIELGGDLTKSTTINALGYNMSINLNGTGDFRIMDGASSRAIFEDGGRVEFHGTLDASGTAGTGVLEIANSLRVDGNEIITNSNSTLYLQSDNNGDLAVDGSTFAVDASANRVGIGTNTPVATLQVIGDINFENNALVSNYNSTSNIDHMWHDDASNTWYFVSDGAYKSKSNNNTFGFVPIGSIVAWHKNIPGRPSLPVGWVECNGGTVSNADSPLNGQAIPNLNNATTSKSGDASYGRFLRGHTSSGVYQTDVSNNLQEINQNADDGGSNTVTLDDDGNWTGWFQQYYSNDRMRFRHAGVETRVTNMSVVWIMRVE